MEKNLNINVENLLGFHLRLKTLSLDVNYALQLAPALI